ncbi:hypothetical protein WPG_1173 [Winogradskyella sp. PG-2]|nr:hypothetical protein WPG_1173 [Winogradskyella sp. PG-2]
MNSFLAKPIKELQALKHYLALNNYSSKTVKEHQTIYCISPYKTGTTFLAAAYNKEIAQHEPMQYLSLKFFEKKFDTFFIKRLNTLNLKLECSGFFSAYIKELTQHKLAKNFEYIVITRKPSSWINSVVNYWAKLDYLQNDYINTYYWKRKVGVDLLNFKHKSESEKHIILDQLASFYFDFTRQSGQLKNITYVNLHDVVDYVKILDTKINEKAQVRNDKRRINTEKYYTYENDKLDEEYAQLILELKSKKT